MGYQLKDRVVFITGASGGIGRACAVEYHRAGCRVVATARSYDKLAELSHELGEDRVFPIQLDVTDADQRAAALQKAREHFGGIDVLVNNAGGGSSVKGGIGGLEETTPEGFDAVYQLNVRVPFFTAQAAARVMAARGGGAICNIVSIDGVFPAPGEGLYGSAKAALVSLTSTLAIELGRHNIRVNAVAPSLIDTKLVARHLATDDQRTDRASFFPINRVGTAEDIAGAVIYLCSDEAGWTSGETLLVAGGQKAASDAIRWLRRVNPVPDGAKF